MVARMAKTAGIPRHEFAVLRHAAITNTLESEDSATPKPPPRRPSIH